MKHINVIHSRRASFDLSKSVAAATRDFTGSDLTTAGQKTNKQVN